MIDPIFFRWTGEAMEPSTKYQAHQADRAFVVGEIYPLIERHERSSATHAHMFAVIAKAHDSLPEHLASQSQFSTPEKLRKYALIRTGYHTQVQHVCKSSAEAERLAAVIRPYDEYQIVETEGVIVTVFHAMSQDHRSMDKKTFQASKTAILDYIDDLIGVERGTTARQEENA